jgi:hypothetical protein
MASTTAFGPLGDARGNQERLVATLRAFTHHDLDIPDHKGYCAFRANPGRQRSCIRLRDLSAIALR